MNRIVLVSTVGCEACRIMESKIREALTKTSKEIEFEKRDISEIPMAKRKALRLKDFPTTIFIKDDLIVKQQIGSNCVAVINRWIDVAFPKK